VINLNLKAVDIALQNIITITVPEQWLHLQDDKLTALQKKRQNFSEVPEYVTKVMDKMMALNADKLPVSMFVPGGYYPTGTCE